MKRILKIVEKQLNVIKKVKENPNTAHLRRRKKTKRINHSYYGHE